MARDIERHDLTGDGSGSGIAHRRVLQLAALTVTAAGAFSLPTLGFAEAHAKNVGADKMQIDGNRSALLLLHYQTDILSISQRPG